MNSLQRYVLALSRVLVAIIFLLSGLGIISQAAAARDRDGEFHCSIWGSAAGAASSC